MRRQILLVSLIALVVGGSASAALPAPELAKVTVFKSLTPEQTGMVLSASDRFIWDHQTETAVAEIPAVNLGSIAAIPATVALSCDFAAAVKSALPEYSPEVVAAGRYAIKEPVALRRPPDAPRRFEPSAGARVEDTCLTEGFEVTPIWYENGGNWWHYQGGQPYNAVGDYYWLDTNCDAYAGSWDAEAIMGGSKGGSLPCASWYDFNTDSWLEFAPWITCAAGAPGAYLSFYAKVYSQTGLDYFYYLASVDGSNYLGYRISGSLYSTWYLYNQNMRAWAGLGDLTTAGRFALAFVFQSGANIPQTFTGYGVRLDNITLSTTSLSVTSVTKMGSPFRLLVSGGGFVPGAWVYINGAPAPAVSFKSPSTLVAKGGATLKAMVPFGQPVCVTVLNPNGGTSPCYTFTR